MINKINKLSKSEFIKVFANIFENARWIAEKLYNQKPFDDFEELSSKILNIFETATKEKQLKILNAHPDLANKTKISLLTPDSLKEQASAGLDQCTEEEFNEFKKLNDAYKKFDFPFTARIKGKPNFFLYCSFKSLNSSNSSSVHWSNSALVCSFKESGVSKLIFVLFARSG